jgi:hypothetical protein
MADHATWWDDPGEAGNDSPVVRHAPDQHQYHVPDYEQTSKMRGSLVGRFAIIPSANRDGTSKGFDANTAGPVHVDPDAPDGGVIFDPSRVTSEEVTQAVTQSHYPHQAFYQLGTPAPLLGYGRGGRFYDQRGDEPPRVNPHLPPNAYITPKAAEDGRQNEVPAFVNGAGAGPSSYNPMYKAQEDQRVNPAPTLSSLGPPPAPAPTVPGQPQQQQYQQSYYPPPPMDPNLVGMMHQLLQGMTQIQQRVAAVEQAAQRPATTGVSPVPMPHGPPPGLATVPAEMRHRQRRHTGQPVYQDDEDYDETARPIRKQVVRDRRTQDVVDGGTDEDANGEVTRHRPPRRRNPNSLIEHDLEEREQTVEDYERAVEQDSPRRGVIAGFETLNIPWLTGPVANKARKSVFFEIPGAGKHSARYHDVVESEHCVVLVYDTRYEDGTQYLPPDLDEERIKLHCPGLKKTFTVSSMGFTFRLGVFDNVMLVKHDVEALDYDEGA